MASTIATMIPNGMSHSSVPSEYDVSSTRTRLRAMATSSGRSERARSSAASRCATRASGDDQHTGTHEPGPPTEVEVLGTGERRGIEPAERGEEVDPHEHRRARDVEDVAHAVVLLLIELPRLDPGVRRAEAVDGAADVEQHARVVGRDELGPDDARVRAVRLLDERADDGRVEHDVVVADEQERRALDAVQRLVGRLGEPGGLGEAADERARQQLGDPRRGIDLTAAVDDHHGEIGVVLVGQAAQRVVEPGPRVPRDDHRRDRRVDGRRVDGFLVDLLDDASDRRPGIVRDRFDDGLDAVDGGFGRAGATAVGGHRREIGPSGGSSVLIRGARVLRDPL